MSELRIKLLELAIQGGATIDNAERVATDWENWAADAHPLKLGVKNPCNGNCRGAYCDESDCIGYKNIVNQPMPDPEIDWSRPQLVEFTHFGGDKTIVETNGEHDHEFFVGRPIGGTMMYGPYAKAGFKYHGEIPAEPKTSFSIEDMQHCFTESRLTHPLAGFKHDSFDEYMKSIGK